MKILIKKMSAMLIVCLLAALSFGTVSVSAAETALNYVGAGHTKYNDAAYTGTDLSMSGTGASSGHVLFFQYDISGFNEDTIVNSATWKAFCSGGTNWNLAFITVMSFDADSSLGSFTANYNDLCNAGFVNDKGTLFSGRADQIEQITLTTDEIPEGETKAQNRYNVDFTNAVKSAIKAGKHYFSFAIKPYTGYNELSFLTSKNPLPILVLDTVAAPKITLGEIAPQKAGTPFNAVVNVTKGDSDISSVTLTVKDANGSEYLDFAEAVVDENTYTWSFPSTMPAGSYTITAKAEDEGGLTATASIKLRILGEESFIEVEANPPEKTAVTYNGMLYNGGDTLKANKNSFITYVTYNLKDNAPYNVNSAYFELKNVAFGGTAELYEVLSGYDEGSIKAGNIPKINSTPLATFSQGTAADVTSLVCENFKNGEKTLSFALKATEELAFKKENLKLTLSQSDNRRPEITEEINCLNAGETLKFNVKDDDIVTEVKAYLNDEELTVTNEENDIYALTLPSDLENGTNKLTLYAKDYSGAESEKNLAVTSGAFGAHNLTVSGSSALAEAENVSEGICLILIKYKDGKIDDIMFTSEATGGKLTLSADDGESYKSIICTEGFNILSVK